MGVKSEVSPDVTGGKDDDGHHHGSGGLMHPHPPPTRSGQQQHTTDSSFPHRILRSLQAHFAPPPQDAQPLLYLESAASFLSNVTIILFIWLAFPWRWSAAGSFRLVSFDLLLDAKRRESRRPRQTGGAQTGREPGAFVLSCVHKQRTSDFLGVPRPTPRPLSARIFQ